MNVWHYLKLIVETYSIIHRNSAKLKLSQINQHTSVLDCHILLDRYTHISRITKVFQYSFAIELVCKNNKYFAVPIIHQKAEKKNVRSVSLNCSPYAGLIIPWFPWQLIMWLWCLKSSVSLFESKPGVVLLDP